MTTLITLLRALPLIGFASLMLFVARRRQRRPIGEAAIIEGGRLPLVANGLAFALFLMALVAQTVAVEAPAAAPLALSGSVIASVGIAVVVRARLALGAAWSLVPKSSESAGLITTGPYRHVRHPIYAGLALMTSGQALAFGSWLALVVVVVAIIPTLLWRARAEERLLMDVFRQSHESYRARTSAVLPRLAKNLRD